MNLAEVKPKQNFNNLTALNSGLKNDEKQSINTTLQGVLINTHIKNQTDNRFSFDEIQNSLLISNSNKYYSLNYEPKDEEKNSDFDIKKALTPLLIGTGAIAGGCFLISSFLKKSSNNLLKTQRYEQLPDLAINMNIKEEPQFAIYRAVRDPNFRNIAGAIGVFIMSGITIACKNFADGAKEIWIKKKSADIEKNLQEKLISVERDSFSGKLKVVNDMMKQNVKYFDSIINSTKNLYSSEFFGLKNEKNTLSNVFKNFNINFKGKDKNKIHQEHTNNTKYMLFTGGILILALILGKMSLSNLKKTLNNTQTFANNYTENTINAIQNISSKADKKDVPAITELLKSVCAKPNFVKEIGKKYSLSEKEIQEIIEQVEKTKKTIFADAPSALGGIPKKIQYYCYLDEPRGHLYNLIINPENKFIKNIFTAFTISGGFGYLFKQGMDALKEIAVMQENAKTDLNLKKQLVEVEIKNFKAKKESAVNPLIDEFIKQAASGRKTKQELKQIADNILTEIKNGPPYVYN